MAVAMRNFTEFGSFPGALRKRGRRYTDTFCGRIFIAIFANVAENECIIHGRSHVTGCHHYNNLLTYCYFQIQLQDWLANVNSRSRSLCVIACPSVCRLSVCYLSVTFVRPTQAIEIFGDVSTSIGTLASADIQVKFYGDRPRGIPPSGDLNRRGVAE